MLRRLPLAVAIAVLGALSLLVALVIIAPGPADFLFASGAVDIVPWVVVGLAVLAAGAVLGVAVGRSATGDRRR
jgi:hypothetical protein